MKFYLSVSQNPSVLMPVFKKSINLIIAIILLQGMEKLNAQKWLELMTKPNPNFYDVQRSFYEEYNVTQSKKDLKKFKRWEWYAEPRVGPSGDLTLLTKSQEEFQNYLRARIAETGGNESGRTLAANWTSTGPYAPYGPGYMGRINFIRFDPTNSNIIWVGSPSGGLWKSTNAGVSWTTNTDLLPVIGCSDLVINPTNTNIMYLATGDGYYTSCNSIGILKSTDGGVTWLPTGLTWQVNQVRVIRRLLIDPANPNTVIAATSNGVYKTTDGGVVWTQTQAGDFGDVKFKPGDPTIVYAVTKNNCLFYKSTNTGTSFTSAATGLPASTSVRRYVIGITPANSAYVYLCAVGTNNTFLAIYRSTNSGTSFTTRATDATYDIVGGAGYYNLAITVSQTNANEVFAGGVDLWRSTDGGLNWLPKYGTHPDHHALEFLPGSGTTVFTGNDGGIFKSTNNGTNWTDLSNGLAISQMYRLGSSAANGGPILTGLQDNGIYKFSNNTWNNIMGADGMESIIDHTNPNIWYMGTQNGWIGKSLDTGNTYTIIVNVGQTAGTVHALSSWVTPYVMHPTDHNTLLVGKRHVFRTVDGGTNWTQLTIPGTDPYMRTLAYAPSNPNYMYAGFAYNFYASTDGNNFVNRNAGLPISTVSITYTTVSNTNPNKVWVTFSGYTNGQKVYQSNDAGVTWTNYSTGLPNLPANCIVYQNGSNDALYVGTDVGVYYRDNTMSSWQPYIDGLPNVMVSELEIHYGLGKLRAATYGRGLWQADLVPQSNPCTPPVNTWMGTISTAWETAGNWSCGVVPDANTDVIINSGTVILSSNTTIRSFNIKTGVNFTVNNGFTLTVSQ